MTLKILTILMGLGLVLNATPVSAQFSTNSGQDTILDADDVTSSKGVVTLSGQAEIRQGDVRLLAEKVRIYTGGNNEGIGISSTSSIDRIEAEEDFYYLTATQEVRGQKGVYTQANNNFVVTGDVILLQDDNIVTGDSLTYNLDTEEARVVSNCKGRKCGRNNRVRVLIKNSGNANTPS